MITIAVKLLLQGLGHVNSRAVQVGLGQATCFPAIRATPEVTIGILGVRYAAKPSVKQFKHLKRFPSHRIGVVRSWDSVHTGMALFNAILPLAKSTLESSYVVSSHQTLLNMLFYWCP